MSQNAYQILQSNPLTTNASTDIIYILQNPGGAGTSLADAAITFGNFSAQFGAPYTPAALTRTNDTNVTLTLGGTPSTSLLQSVSLTVGWSGQLSVGRGGTGASTLTGLLTGNGTSAITGTAITQYNVLTGGASNAPNSVAPSSTSGVPLISQGSSSQPVFGTATVAGGGTGITSTTAYSVLCGGTTTTGALQSVSGLGSSGQVLTSNGVGALPTWQNAGGSSPAAYKQPCAAQLDSGLASSTTYSNGSSGVGATLTNAGAQSALVTDGYTAQLGDRILVQSGASSDAYNGIYTVTNIGSNSTNWVLTRATDANTPANLPYGFQVSIQNGNTNQAKVYFCYSNVNTIGTDNIELFLVYGFKPHAYLPLLISNNLSELEFYGNVVTARANLSVPQMVIYHNGNPNGSIQGSEGDLLIDDSTNRLFLCTSSGNSNWLVVAPIRGTATLSGGTVTVSTTNISSTSQIFLSAQDNNTTGALRVSARTAGTSFTITSSNAGDSGVVAYEIFEPA